MVRRKEVKTLKPKHRLAVWIDCEGDLWIYSSALEAWEVYAIASWGEGFERVSDEVDAPFSPDDYGPFVRVYKIGQHANY